MDISAPTSDANSVARRDLDLLNKKLEGDAGPVFAAPYEADEVNRNKGKLPEHVEQETVVGGKYADEGHLHQQDQAIEGMRLFVIGIKRRQDD